MRVLLTVLIIAGLIVAPVAAQEDPPEEITGPVWWIALIQQFVGNPIFAPVAGPAALLATAWAWENKEAVAEAVSHSVQQAGEGTNSIIDVINQFAEVVIGGLTSIVRFIGEIINAVGAIVRLIGQLVEVVIAVIGRIWDYMTQAVSLFFEILGTINDAPPEQIPGLPRCVSAPTQYQICAVWYIVDWTLIADNTPGAMLVPLIILILDIGIAFYVMRSAWRMIHWFGAQLGDG